MKAPVDYPLDASTLLKELHGDELTHLSMLDRVEAKAQPNKTNSGQTLPNAGLKRRRIKRRRISEKPAVIDAPMNVKGTVKTTSQAENSTQKGVFLNITRNEKGAVEAHQSLSSSGAL